MLSRPRHNPEWVTDLITDEKTVADGRRGRSAARIHWWCVLDPIIMAEAKIGSGERLVRTASALNMTALNKGSRVRWQEWSCQRWEAP
jgi:hypothetical protein